MLLALNSWDCVEGANSLNRNGKRNDKHVVLLGNKTSICAHKANSTWHIQMAASENEVNAPSSVC